MKINNVRFGIGVAALMLFMQSVNAGEVTTICKEKGRYIGWPTICRRAESGELLVVFSGDRAGHVCPYGKVQMVRSKDDGRTWSALETLFKGKIDYRDAGIVELADGTLVCNWFTSVAFALDLGDEAKLEWRQPHIRHYNELSDAEVDSEIGFWSARSTDGGRTWTDRTRMPAQLPHNVTRLKNGKLLAVARRIGIGKKGAFVDKDKTPIIVQVSADGARTWREQAVIAPFEGSYAGLYEPHTAELPDGRLVCQIRSENKAWTGLLQTESEDGGLTWSALHRIPLRGFPSHLLTLRDGRLLSVYSRRDYAVQGWDNGEYACLSSDGGRTWDVENEILLAKTPSNDHGYPASVELPMGEILTVFYAQEKSDELTCLRAVRWRPPYAKPAREESVITVKPGDSLVAARDAARKARKPVAVELADGVYPIDATLKFGPEDSDVIWRAAKDAKPVISGAIAIEGWKDDGDGSWSAPLPKGADGKPAYFDQLWINGRRAARSVWPKDRWLAVANPWLETVTNDTVESYVQHVDVLPEDVKDGDPIAAASKADLEFLQLRVVHQWTFARCNVKDYVAKNRQVVSYTDLKWPWYNYWSTMKTVISFENVRAAFTEPGDWFYDAPAGRVRYRPLNDEKIADARASREGLTQLVEIRGTRQAPVRDLKFRGIAFEGSAVTPLKPGLRGPNESIQYQAACFSDAAVLVDHAEWIDFTECAVRHTGNYAIDFRDGSFDCTVERCRFEDLGAGGVRMGSKEQHVTAAEGGKPARRLIQERHPESVAGITLVDSVVNRYGEMNPEAVGVSVMYASDCKVLHNDIGDGFYSGVSVGWTWGYSGSVAQRNEVAFNHVHDLGKHLMSDMAGVYTLGTSYGARVHDNVVHDIDIRDYGGPGLYADEGSEGVIFERNLCYNTETLCTQNYGTGCIYRNNVFAFPKKPAGHAVLLVAAVDDNVPSSLHIVNNIFLTDGVPMVLQTRGDVEGIRMNNVWWNMARPCEGEFDGLDWKTWLELDRERNSVYADPKFVDAKKFDFRLLPDSPAIALGFRPFDYTKVGPRAR